MKHKYKICLICHKEKKMRSILKKDGETICKICYYRGSILDFTKPVWKIKEKLTPDEESFLHYKYHKEKITKSELFKRLVDLTEAINIKKKNYEI